MLLLHDKVKISAREKTPEGYLKVTARMSRTGVQDYHPRELGLNDSKKTLIRLYRSEDEVFSEDSMKSFALKPVTDNHPAELVSADNFRSLAIGFSGEKIVRDGNYLRGTLVITDPTAIARIENGPELSEVSLGYTLDVDMTPGFTKDGEAYDGRQINIRGNHIALLGAGRCGGACRLDDSKPPCECASCKTKDTNMNDVKLTKSVLIDGLPVETNEHGAQIIERMQRQLTDAKESVKKILDTNYEQSRKHAEALTAKDAEIAQLKAATTPQQLAKLMDARIKIILSAKDFLPDDYSSEEKSNEQIARDAVTFARGADAVTGKSDQYVMAMFDALTEPEPTTTNSRVPTRVRAQDRGASQHEYNDRISNAWKPQAAQS